MTLSIRKFLLIAACTAALIAAGTRQLHAQGASSASAFISWDDEFIGEGAPTEGFEQTVLFEIDDDLSMYAYTETYANDDGDFEYSGLDLQTELDITEDGYLIGASYADGDGGDAYTEYSGDAEAGHTYGAEGIAWLGVEEWYEGDYSYYEDDIGGVSAFVSTNAITPTPYVSYVDPVPGTAGDSNVEMTFYGESLLNSDGSLPSTWISPSALHVYPQSTSNSGEASTPEQLFAQYSIDSGTSPGGGIIDLITDGGWSNDVSVSVTAPDAEITSISPPTWPSGGSPFDITIYGTNLGNVPTVLITSDNNDISHSTPVTVNSDGSITTTITVPSDEAGTYATVSVTPGNVGCTGGCYTSADPQNPSGSAAPVQVQVTPTTNSCPSSITYNSSATVVMPLAGKVANGWLTGIGIMTQMQVGPSTTTFDGSKITEVVTTVTGPNRCPLAQFGNNCKSSATPFTVGDGGGGVGGKVTGDDGITQVSAASNAFWDQHDTISTTNDLDEAGMTSCTIVCTQTYSCNGSAIPGATFTIERDYSLGSIGNYSVTNVTVSKH